MKIKLLRNTIIQNLGACSIGDIVEAPKDLSLADANYLVKRGKAELLEAPKPKSKRGGAEKAEAPAGSAAAEPAPAEENPMIKKAMQLAGVDTVADLAAMTDEDLGTVRGIGPKMVEQIREILGEA